MEADQSLALEPHRRAAQEALAEAARLRFPKGHFAVATRTLATVLRRHGLGQALAYVQLRVDGAKGTTPYDVLAGHLDRWLLAATGASGRTALVALAARDSRFYREATAQAWLWVRALAAAQEETA